MNSSSILVCDPFYCDPKLKHLTLLYEELYFVTGYRDRKDLHQSMWGAFSNRGKSSLSETPPWKYRRQIKNIWKTHKDSGFSFHPIDEHEEYLQSCNGWVSERVKDEIHKLFPNWIPDKETEWMTIDDAIETHLLYLGYWSKYLNNMDYYGDHLENSILYEYAKKSLAQSVEESHAFTLPCVDDLTWSEILDLRKSPYLKNYRQKLWHYRGEKRFADDYLETLEKLAADVRPSIVKSASIGIFSNIPLPIPLNPVGIYDSVRSVKKNKEMLDKYGWVYFILEANEKAEKQGAILEN